MKYLPIYHIYNSQKGPFNGNPQHYIAPKIVHVPNIFVETEGKEENWGKSECKNKKRNIEKTRNFNAIMCKKRLILFSLPHG